MSLAKRSSRRITVDGVPYRWAVSVDSGFFTIVVQLAEGQGSRLEAQTTERHWGDTRSIAPGGIAAMIRHALDSGWAPETGTPYRIQDIDTIVSLDGSGPANPRPLRA